MYKPPCRRYPDGTVILQVSGLSYLRVKGFEDTIYCGVKFIEKALQGFYRVGYLFDCTRLIMFSTSLVILIIRRRTSGCLFWKTRNI